MGGRADWRRERGGGGGDPKRERNKYPAKTPNNRIITDGFAAAAAVVVVVVVVIFNVLFGIYLFVWKLEFFCVCVWFFSALGVAVTRWWLQFVRPTCFICIFICMYYFFLNFPVAVCLCVCLCVCARGWGGGRRGGGGGGAFPYWLESADRLAESNQSVWIENLRFWLVSRIRTIDSVEKSNIWNQIIAIRWRNGRAAIFKHQTERWIEALVIIFVITIFFSLSLSLLFLLPFLFCCLIETWVVIVPFWRAWQHIDNLWRWTTISQFCLLFSLSLSLVMICFFLSPSQFR